jgi:hypothetical protein
MLSLEAASGMLGATNLVEPLQELRGVVDSCSGQQRAAMLARVENEAIRLRHRLEAGDPPDASRSVL